MKRRGEYQAREWQLKKHVKRNNVAIDVEVVEDEVEAGDNNNHTLYPNSFDNNIVRRWEELDREILVSIMQRLNGPALIYSACFVCKSWLNAVLDTLFPPKDVLNLGTFPPIPGFTAFDYSRWWSLAVLHLNREQATYHTKLVFPPPHFNQVFPPRSYLTRGAYEFIAKRLPSLKSIDLSLHSYGLHSLLNIASSYWKGLVEVECHVSSLDSVSYLWNQINSIRLSVLSEVKETDALILARRFPNLTQLSLRRCKLIGNALNMILEGKMNLVYLDTTHATLHDQEVPSVAKDWDQSILRKAKGIAKLVQCGMRNCPCCCHKYVSSSFKL